LFFFVFVQDTPDYCFVLCIVGLLDRSSTPNLNQTSKQRREMS
jgi:hypothetical protein